MTERDTFTMAEEFAGVDFNEERLGKRFRKTMETLAKDPRKSIYGNSANRAEAKAIYNLLGNDKFNKREFDGNIRQVPVTSGYHKRRK